MFGRERRRLEREEHDKVLADLATALARNADVTAAALSAIAAMRAGLLELADEIRRLPARLRPARGPDRAPRKKPTQKAPPARSGPPTAAAE